jgi:hypothetical protein
VDWLPTDIDRWAVLQIDAHRTRIGQAMTAATAPDGPPFNDRGEYSRHTIM